MARVFENTDDRVREQELAEILEKSWKCQAVRNPDFAHIDLTLCRDNTPRAHAELKHSRYAFGTFSQYMINSIKIQAARDLHRDTGLPVFLVVRWSDRITYVSLHDLKPIRELRQWCQDRKKFMMVSWFDIKNFRILNPKHP